MARAAHHRRPDHHAAAARRLPQAGQPAVVGARAAGQVVEVRRETVDSATLVIKPGWGFSFDYDPGQYIGIGLLVDGRWRWRSYSLTSTPVSDGRTNHHDHREGDARGLPVHPPRRRSRAGNRRPARRAAGQLRHARPRAGIGAVPHRGLRRHARSCRCCARWRAATRSPTSSTCIRRQRNPTSCSRRSWRNWPDAHPGYRMQASRHAHRRSPRPGPARRRGAGLARSPDLGVRSGGDAQRRRSASGRRQASASGCTSNASRCPRAAPHGAGGTVTFERSGKTVSADAADLADGCGRDGRRADAVRLPDGNLPVVRGESGRRPRARSADGRRARAGQPGPDVRFRSLGRLRARRLTFTGR